MSNKSKTPLSLISRFDPIQNTWTKLGNLKIARRRHAAIQLDNEFIVVGGDVKGHVATESCKLNGQSMVCTTREPNLNFFSYPELMLIQ